ncbi:MAG: tRNA dihydrouridine synthase DusB [Calditrichia bacterium]
MRSLKFGIAKYAENEIETIYIKPLKIGNLVTAHNLVLAPLAGISDYPFRQLNRDFGADLTFTEMVSIDGLVYQNEATQKLLRIYPREKPVGFQFFGSDPDMFKRIIPQAESFKPDIIDINFGCPVRKVVAKGAGSALLKDLNLMRKIVESVKASTGIPVSAKIRIGWDMNSIVAVEAARAVEAGGADALTVHARTRSQGYSGRANWEYIAKVKQALRIPVIGNGDVVDGPSALEMFETTGADGVMIARGALGRPWIFRSILEYLRTGKSPEPPSLEERLQLMERHYDMEMQEFEEFVALSRMKKHFAWYTHGLPHTAKLRNSIFRAGNIGEVRTIFSEYRKRFEHKEIFS